MPAAVAPSDVGGTEQEQEEVGGECQGGAQESRSTGWTDARVTVFAGAQYELLPAHLRTRLK